MNAGELQTHLLTIQRLDGMIGCAVVDMDTGMTWESTGGDEVQHLCECATDFWRLQLRNATHYALLGELAAQVLMHAKGRITLVRCPGSLLLVCISAEPDHVDWPRWKALVHQLNQLAASN